jgi:hypothetical protein
MLHQILVEVHGCPDETVLDFMDSFEKAGYLRYHKEPNIQGDPNCLELGMIKVRVHSLNRREWISGHRRFPRILPVDSFRFDLRILYRYREIL